MDRDEILSKSREENKNRDFFKEEIYMSAGTLGSITATILATVFFVIQRLVGDGWDFGLYAIVFSIGSITFTAKAIYFKHIRDIILSVIYIAATLVLSIMHIYGLIVG